LSVEPFLNLIRFDVQCEAATPAREQIIVQDVSRNGLGCHAELFETLLSVVLNEFGEGNSTNLVLNTVGLKVAALHLCPSVLLRMGPSQGS
jgi:hypothetical protein